MTDRLSVELSLSSIVCQWSYHYRRVFVSGAITIAEGLTVELSLLSRV